MKIQLPTDEDNFFDLTKDFLSNWQDLKQMMSFRNILVHRYGKIEDDKVYEMNTQDMEDFDIFLDDVRTILKK